MRSSSKTNRTDKTKLIKKRSRHLKTNDGRNFAKVTESTRLSAQNPKKEEISTKYNIGLSTTQVSMTAANHIVGVISEKEQEIMRRRVVIKNMNIPLFSSSWGRNLCDTQKS